MASIHNRSRADLYTDCQVLSNRSAAVAVGRFAVAFLLLAGATGADWPQFRGPDGQGHAVAHDLPDTWSETENITWKTAISGRGWSSPVVLGDQIWMTTALDEGHSLHAICVDRKSGQIVHNVEVFQVEAPPTINEKNSYASPTSVIEPGRIYVHFGTLGTACLDSQSGRIVWTNRDLRLEHKEGPGSSPIVCRDFLIVNCDGMDVQYVVALDKKTGKIVWKTDRPGPLPENKDFRKAYATPLVIDLQGREQLVSTGAHQVLGYDPATGAQLWRVPYEGFSNVPRPLFDGELLYICTGYMKPQLWALRPLADGTFAESEIAWKMTKQVPANSTPIIVGERIFMVSDQGVATCLDKRTGSEIWKERLGGSYSASPVFGDGKLYFSSEEGVTTVLAPRDQFESLSKNQLEGSIMGSPAICDTAIFLRTDQHLYRIERGQPRTAQRAAARD